MPAAATRYSSVVSEVHSVWLCLRLFRQRFLAQVLCERVQIKNALSSATQPMQTKPWHHLTGKLVQQGWIISTAIHFLAMTKTLKLNNLIPMPCPKYRYSSISNWGPAYEDLELCCGCQDLPGKLSLPDYRRDLSLRSCQMHINPGPEENAATIKNISRRQFGFSLQWNFQLLWYKGIWCTCYHAVFRTSESCIWHLPTSDHTSTTNCCSFSPASGQRPQRMPRVQKKRTEAVPQPRPKTTPKSTAFSILHMRCTCDAHATCAWRHDGRSGINTKTEKRRNTTARITQ